jgi:hypothetical protein
VCSKEAAEVLARLENILPQLGEASEVSLPMKRDNSSKKSSADKTADEKDSEKTYMTEETQTEAVELKQQPFGNCSLKELSLMRFSKRLSELQTEQLRKGVVEDEFRREYEATLPFYKAAGDLLTHNPPLKTQQLHSSSLGQGATQGRPQHGLGASSKPEGFGDQGALGVDEGTSDVCKELEGAPPSTPEDLSASSHMPEEANITLKTQQSPPMLVMSNLYQPSLQPELPTDPAAKVRDVQNSFKSSCYSLPECSPAPSATAVVSPLIVAITQQHAHSEDLGIGSVKKRVKLMERLP